MDFFQAARALGLVGQPFAHFAPMEDRAVPIIVRWPGPANDDSIPQTDKDKRA